MKLLAFDPGLANTGYGSLSTDTEGRPTMGRAFGVLHTKPEDGTDRERIDLLNVKIKRLLIDFKPDAVGLEDWSYMGNRGKNESSMPALIENIRQLCLGLGIPVYIYENPEWKKITLGIRGANKKQVKHYVTKNVPGALDALNRKPDHIWDSVGICFAIYKQYFRGSH